MVSRAYNLALLYDGLRASDTLVAKVIGISYAAQIEKIASRLFSFIDLQWRDLSAQAILLSSKALRVGSGHSVLKADVENALGIVDSTMGQWPALVTSRFTTDMREVYSLGSLSALKKVKSVTKADKPPSINMWMKPSFDLVDTAAMQAFERHQVFWIGEFYKTKISSTIAATSLNQITSGIGRVRAGDIMGQVVKDGLANIKIPDGFNGTSRQYFQGLVGNATTTERTAGHLRTFAKAGITVYVVINPLDQRTCETCSWMDGKQFRVVDGMAQLDKVINAKTPKQVKGIHPWLTPKSAAALAKKKGPAGVKDTGALQARGHALPTYHFFCRCGIDIERSAIAFPPDADLPAFPKPPISPRLPSFPKVPYRQPTPPPLLSPKLPPIEPSKPPIELPLPKLPVAPAKVPYKAPKLPKKPPKPKPLAPDIAAPSGATLPSNVYPSLPVLPEHKELMASVRTLRDLWENASTPKGYTKFRIEMERILEAKWGMTRNRSVSGSLDWMEVVDVDKMSDGVGGFMNSLGAITIRKDQAMMVEQAFQSVEKKNVDAACRGLKSVIHEVIHGADRIPTACYKDAGKVLCEATTELAARRVVNDLANFRNQSGITSVYLKSYNEEINDLVDAVRQATQWQAWVASDQTSKAAVLMHSNFTPDAKTIDEAIDSFVRAIDAGKKLTAAQKLDLAKRIKKLRVH